MASSIGAASERADLYDSEHAEAQEASRARFVEASDHGLSLLQLENERIDGLVDALLAEGGADPAALIDSLGAFDRGSTIKAVEVERISGLKLFLPGGLVPTRQLPIVTAGVSEITGSQWAGEYAYRVFSEEGPVRSVTLILDLGGFEIGSPQIKDFRIEGLTDSLPLTSVGAKFEEHNAELFSNPETGELTGVRSFEIFGRPGRLVLLSSPDAIVEYKTWEASQAMYVAITGGLLSIGLAILVHIFIRRFDRRSVQRRLEASARERAVERFSASFTHAPVGVVELNCAGEIDLVNPRFGQLLGYLAEELEGNQFLDLVDTSERQIVSERIDEILSGSAAANQSERRYRDRNGAAIWVRESVSSLSTLAGEARVLVQIEDISDERRSRVELHRRALFDDLTGLPNRANLVERLDRAVDEANQGGAPLAVMFLDLNKFKAVNDTYGHEAGDLLLIEVAERLRATSRESDLVARLGGDEFVVVCEQITRENGAEAAANRFAKSLNQPAMILGVEHAVKASIGLALSGDGTAEDLLRRADEAMYQSKSDSELAFVKYDASMPSALVNRETHEMALRQAIDKGELVFHFQPILQLDLLTDSATNDGAGLTRLEPIVGIEALIRWNHPTEGLINPSEFLPLAGRLGLLEAIDEMCIRAGSSQLVKWSNQVPAAGAWFLSINTSAQHYRDPAFPDRVVSILAESGLHPSRLVLERDESTMRAETQVMKEVSARLRSFGTRIVLDRFGSETTKLGQLPKLEIDAIKLDQTLLVNNQGLLAPSDEDGYILDCLKAIQALAAHLHLDVMVSGIESERELDLAKAAEIGVGQGFHFSRPLSAPEFESRLFEEATTFETAASETTATNPRTTRTRASNKSASDSP